MMERTVVRVGEDQTHNPVFFLEEPQSHELSRTHYSLLFPVMSFTADAVTGILEIPKHGLSAGQEVAVKPATDADRLPYDLRPDSRYYVIVKDADHVQLSESPGGPALTFAVAGSGNNLLFAW